MSGIPTSLQEKNSTPHLKTLQGSVQIGVWDTDIIICSKYFKHFETAKNNVILHSF